MKSLQDSFTISTGYTFRDAIAGVNVGGIGVVQASDVNRGDLNSIVRIASANQNHFLQAGDILLSSRGEFTARTVTVDILPAIASSSVMVLRPLSSSANPRYIARYINSTAGQLQLQRITSGSAIKTLRKSELVHFQIPEANKHTQSTVIKLHDIIEKQRQVLRLKEQLLQQIDNSLINQVGETL